MRQNIGKGRVPSNPPAEDMDDHALTQDLVSITPLQADLTAYDYIPRLREWILPDAVKEKH